MTALRLIVPVVLLAVVWQVADGRQALARIGAADLLWMALAFAALQGQTILSALRWRLISDAVGQPIAAGTAVREYYVSQILNQTLPGGVLGDAARAVRAAPAGALRAAGAAVVMDRALGQVALFGVLIPGLVASAMFGALDWPAVLLPLLVGGVVTLTVVLIALAQRGGGRGCLRRALDATRGRWRFLTALSIVIVALNLAAFAAAARATGTVLGAEAVVTLIPLILSAMLIPLTIAGWGWREGAAAALFPLAGAAPDAGLGASAAFGALMLAGALPGALWLARPAGPPPA